MLFAGRVAAVLTEAKTLPASRSANACDVRITPPLLAGPQLSLISDLQSRVGCRFLIEDQWVSNLRFATRCIG